MTTQMRWLELKGNFSDPWTSLGFVAWASSKCWWQIKVMKKCVDFVDKPGIRVVPRPRYVSLAFGKYRVVFVVKIQTKTFYLRFTQSNAWGYLKCKFLESILLKKWVDKTVTKTQKKATSLSILWQGILRVQKYRKPYNQAPHWW